ncbi:hypothetical protein FS749_013060 [Ceratobasidium sp. UAMH 11750]|nr:hypothetical protein FS749_013060 [Ceratobasidium sp. UAMH 11750]
MTDPTGTAPDLPSTQPHLTQTSTSEATTSRVDEGNDARVAGNEQESDPHPGFTIPRAYEGISDGQHALNTAMTIWYHWSQGRPFEAAPSNPPATPGKGDEEEKP